MASNQVQVIFTANAAPLIAEANKVKTKLSEVSTAAQNPISLGFGPDSQRQIDATMAKVQQFRAQLRDTLQLTNQSGSAVWRTFHVGADRAAAQARGLYSELRRINIVASGTSDPKLLATLRAQAQAAEAEIDRLNRKVQRVGAGRAAAVERLASGNGGFGRVRSAASGLAGLLPAEVTNGLGAVEGLSAAGVGAGALAIGSGIALLGAKIVSESKRIREEAEKQLGIQERIQGELNRQIIARKEQLAQMDAQRELAEKQRQLQAFLATADDDAIKRKIALYKQLRDITPDAANREFYDQSITQGQAALSGNDANRQAAADAAFAARFAAMQAEQRRQAEDRQKGIEKVGELGRSWREAFGGLPLTAGGDNPFVRIYTDAEKAVKSFREQTQGLTAELRAQGETLIKNAANLAYFKAAVDSRMNAFDLRERARIYRDGTPEEQARQREAALNRFDAQIAAEEREGFYRNPYVNALRRAQIARTSGDDQSAAKRLDRAMRELRRGGASNAEEQSVLDQRLLALGSSIDPSQLRQDQRNQLAAAAERQAERVERRQQDALDLQKKSYEMQKELHSLQKKFYETADKSGIAGVETLIKVQNDTTADVGVRESLRQPTPEDTNRTYSLGTFGGDGGLTSF